MAEKIALVTGASGGIGSACAQQLAREGYTVLAHANRGIANAQQLAAQLCAGGCDVHAVQADLSDSAQANAMCADILRVYHRVDALVLCAGIAHTGLLCDMTDAQWHAVMDTNVSSAFYLCRALAPGMVSRRSGAIVTISSMWGRVGASCEAAYSATKGAVLALSKALAQELGPSHIRVNAICPGVIQTDMCANVAPEVLESLREQTPIERLGTPEDIAQAMAFLVDAPFITGQVLGVNGGFVIT